MARPRLSIEEKKLRGTYRKGREAARLPVKDEPFNISPYAEFERDKHQHTIHGDALLERCATNPEYLENEPEWCEEVAAEIAKRRSTIHGYGKRYIWGQYYCPDSEWPDGPKNTWPKPEKPAEWCRR